MPMSDREYPFLFLLFVYLFTILYYMSLIRKNLLILHVIIDDEIFIFKIAVESKYSSENFTEKM